MLCRKKFSQIMLQAFVITLLRTYIVYIVNMFEKNSKEKMNDLILLAMFLHGRSLWHPILIAVPGTYITRVLPVISALYEPRIFALLTLSFTSFCTPGIPRYIVQPLKGTIVRSIEKPRRI